MGDESGHLPNDTWLVLWDGMLACDPLRSMTAASASCNELIRLNSALRGHLMIVGPNGQRSPR